MAGIIVMWSLRNTTTSFGVRGIAGTSLLRGTAQSRYLEVAVDVIGTRLPHGMARPLKHDIIIITVIITIIIIIERSSKALLPQLPRRSLRIQ